MHALAHWIRFAFGLRRRTGARSMNATLDLPLHIPLDPNDDPEPRAVWATTFAATRPHVSFEQAMRDKILSHSIAQVSLKRARRLAGQCK